MLNMKMIFSYMVNTMNVRDNNCDVSDPVNIMQGLRVLHREKRRMAMR